MFVCPTRHPAGSNPCLAARHRGAGRPGDASEPVTVSSHPTAGWAFATLSPSKKQAMERDRAKRVSLTNLVVKGRNSLGWSVRSAKQTDSRQGGGVQKSNVKSDILKFPRIIFCNHCHTEHKCIITRLIMCLRLEPWI